jgi:pyruvate-ferredoxin/flavodoxin oxidoreductase
VRAFLEAESFPGPSIIIAFSHCIAHGYDMAFGLDQQKLAVDTGYWPLYRYDPRLADAGENPLKLDSAPPKIDLQRYMRNESRFRLVEQTDAERYRMLLGQAQQEVKRKYSFYEELARASTPKAPEGGHPPAGR